jgi:signal transduction histidine kinase
MSKNETELLKSIPLAIYESDFSLERNFSICNKYTLDFFQIEKCSGRCFTDFIAKESRNEYEEEFKFLSKVKRPILLTYKVFTSSGKEKWVQDQIIPVLDKDGEIESLHGILTDVTIQRKAELIMFDYNEALKKGIEEKTFQLTILNRELSNSNKLKDKFFSIIAHDLRGPFSGLMNYIQLIIEESDSKSKEELFETLKDIYESSKGLYKLMENLLTWSQIQTDTLKLDKQEINVLEMIEDIVGATKINAKVKNITIKTYVNKDLKIYGDFTTIKTAIYNVLTNAIKFTPTNGEILINSNFIAKSVYVEIKDNGVGMPNDVKNNIFNLQDKVSRNGTEGEKGTGLGLILTKEFVELNKGAVNIMSEDGNGTTITMAFPNINKVDAA